MKRLFILTVIALTLIAGRALAAFDQSHILLKDADNLNTLLDFSLTSGTAVFSATIDTQHNAGSAALLIKEDKSGGLGDVDISVEYSLDGSNWYTAYFQDATIDTSIGILHKEGDIITALQNDTKWVTYTPRASRFLRYKFDPNAERLKRNTNVRSNFFIVIRITIS